MVYLWIAKGSRLHFISAQDKSYQIGASPLSKVVFDDLGEWFVTCSQDGSIKQNYLTVVKEELVKSMEVKEFSGNTTADTLMSRDEDLDFCYDERVSQLGYVERGNRAKSEFFLNQLEKNKTLYDYKEQIYLGEKLNVNIFGDFIALENYFKNGHQFPETTAYIIVLQVLSALQALSEAEILHGGINPSCILLRGDDDNPDVVLSEYLSPMSLESTKPQNFKYLSPEVLKGGPFGPKADIWSLGCIFYELMERRELFFWRRYFEYEK